MSNPGQPIIERESQGDVVRRAQRALRRVPDHSVAVDGIVGDKTWAVPLHAASATLATAVGLKWADD